MLKHLGAFTYQFRKTIMISWLILTIGIGFFAVKLPTVLNGSGFKTNGEYQQVENILQNDFGQPKSTMILLFHSNSLSPQDPAYQSFVKKTLNALHSTNHLTGITSPYQQKNRMKKHSAYATLSFNAGIDSLDGSIKQIRDHLKNSKDMTVGLSGGPVIASDLNHASQHDLEHAEMVGVPAALLILILAFGSLTAAALPLITGILSVIAAMGCIYFFGLKIDLSIFLLNVIPMVGLALGIDFALLLVNRFRKELSHFSVRDALIRTVETAGRSIAFSGLCVFLGLIGMLFIQVNIFQTIALGGMVVVLLSVTTALTFLPALLAVLGPNVDRLRIFRSKDNPGRSIWYKWASAIMKRPVILLVLSVIILFIGMIPIQHLKLTIPDAESLPAHAQSRTAYETFQHTFGKSNLSPVIFVVQSQHSMKSKENLEQLHHFVGSLGHDSVVRKTQSIYSATHLSPDSLYAADKQKKLKPALSTYFHKNEAVVYAFLNVAPDSAKAKSWVRRFDHTQNGFHILIGGQSKFSQEIFDELFNKIPYGLVFIFLSTFIILMIAFRSVLLPLKAILMDALSLSATFGILVWLFQEGHIYAPSEIGLMIPVFVFALVFGLSMDYEVFLISRIQEEYIASGDNDSATLAGLASTSKIISSAAAIMIVVTGCFAFTGVVPIRQLGAGIALAIFIDATIIRMILVPSLMKLLGRLNWWFPFGRKKETRL